MLRCVLRCACVRGRIDDDDDDETTTRRLTRAVASREKVHFSLTDVETGEIVRDTRADAEPIQFVCSERTSRDDRIVGRGAGSDIPALDVCAVGLTTGERATFEAPAEFAYGEAGNFSFPTVGKNRVLLLDIDVLGVLGSADEPDELQSDMTYEARVKRVKRHRANGNELFTTGDAAGAIREYSMALTYLTEDFMMQLFDKYEIEANQEYASVHGNLCAAYLKLNAFEDVIAHAAYVLKVDANNAKAYYRRGKARASLGQDDAAREDFLKAKKITEDAGTKDANVVKALRDLDIETRARDKASAEVFKGMFTTTHASTTDAANDAPAPPAPRGLFSRWFGAKPR